MSTDNITRSGGAQLVEALDAERAAYAHMRELLPELDRPARDRQPLTEAQRAAVEAWHLAERHLHLLHAAGG